MKRSFFGLLAAALLGASLTSPATPTAPQTMQPEEARPAKGQGPITDLGQIEPLKMQFRQSPTIATKDSTVRYRGITGPRRVKYGKNRWVLLS